MLIEIGDNIMITINPKLEKYIFEELHGVYSPSYLEAVDNLGNDEERNLRYLGTYFPRTFVEAYRIYENLFSKKAVYDKFAELKTINVLTIGSGTGGDLIGLVTLLNQIYQDKFICIHSYDGNVIALKYQEKILNDSYKYMDCHRNRVILYTKTCVFNERNSIKDCLKEENFDEFFHIVQSFKFGNELFNSLVNENVFLDLMYIAADNLIQSGIFVMEDVTIRNIDSRYNPCEMTNQVRKYYKHIIDSDLIYVIPKSCAKWNNFCRNKNCFSQVIFNSENRYAKDISKVTFKVFIMNPLGTEVVSQLGSENCYLLSDRTYCTGENYYYNQDNPPKDPWEFAFKL